MAANCIYARYSFLSITTKTTKAYFYSFAMYSNKLCTWNIIYS